jgi:hypothetical protein
MKEHHCMRDRHALVEEKRLASRELLAEAWDEGIGAGIEPELLAEEIVFAVLGELERARGHAVAASLSEQLVRLASEGHILRPRLLQ